MTSIMGFGSIPGAGGNPLAGMSTPTGATGLDSLSGMVDGGTGLGVGGGDQGGTGGSTGTGGSGLGIAPLQPASSSQGSSFSDTLKSMVIDGPSASKKTASDLTARFAAGENIDPHQLAVANAKAGVEIQMATRSISSAVSAVRTLFQMQI